MHQIIPLEPNAEIATIRAKIENAEFSHVVLVAPRHCAALSGDPGLSLVRRAAEDSGAQVALVTRDEELRARARRFGLPTFNSIHQAQRAHWQMVPLARGFGEEIALAPELDAQAFNPSLLARLKAYRYAIALLGGALVCLALAAVLFIPAARVRIVPAPIALMINAEISADPTISQVSSAQLWLPARKVTREVNGTAQLKTAAQKAIPDARSAGTVVFTNQKNEEVIIPQNTIVKTSAGVPIRFTVVATATLPAGIGNRVEAPIQAVDPGPSGNVKELAINTIEGQLNVDARVINLKPTAQGNLRNVRIVTADDKKKLEAQLMAQLWQQGATALTAELKPGEFVLPDSVSIDANDVSFDRAVDEPADGLNLRIAGYAVGLAVDREDLDLLVRAFAQKQLQEGYELLPTGIQSDALGGGKYAYPAFKFPMRGVAYAVPQIDSAKVARALQGRTVRDAQEFLTSNLPLAHAPEISVVPPGWFLLPWFNFRIAVYVETQAVGAK